MPTPPKPPETPKSSNGIKTWGARLTVDLGPGVIRHPRVLDLVQDFIEPRVSGVDMGNEGVRVSFPAGDTREEAEAALESIALGVVDLLGLTASAVTEAEVYECDPRLLLGPLPHLEIVPDPNT